MNLEKDPLSNLCGIVVGDIVVEHLITMGSHLHKPLVSLKFLSGKQIECRLDSDHRYCDFSLQIDHKLTNGTMVVAKIDHSRHCLHLSVSTDFNGLFWKDYFLKARDKTRF